MTREQIEKAADKHSFKYLSQDGIEELDLECHYEAGFIDGVQWRINSVWHDKTEKPKQDKVFLYEDEFGKYDTDCIYKTEMVDWNMYSRTLSLVRWAYVEDLLPERKEETE